MIIALPMYQITLTTCVVCMLGSERKREREGERGGGRERERERERTISITSSYIAASGITLTKLN